MQTFKVIIYVLFRKIKNNIFNQNRRGIVAAPVLNGYCGDYEYGMEKSNIFDPVFNYGWPVIQ